MKAPILRLRHLIFNVMRSNMSKQDKQDVVEIIENEDRIVLNGHEIHACCTTRCFRND